ncbi:P-loop containing nucleoside triphosphate hydrolase protein, partial [Melanogaster broomeanus]
MAPVQSVATSVQQDVERAERCLTHAQSEATRKHKYDSVETRAELTRLVTHSCGKVPYPWQLDVAEAMILGVDSVVIVGTGAGKTLPFVMPLLHDKTKSVIIISPLKALQRDQKRRFKTMGISAIDVNGDTWTSKMRQDLKNHQYQAVLLGPEMCLQHEGFRELLKSPDFTKSLVGVVIDEAHCISQWGGDFRTAYSKLGELRSYVPPSIPILATSATLAPGALQEVRQKLQIDSLTSFFVNLGNDRPNITPYVLQMKNSSDYAALLDLVAKGVRSPEDLSKMIIFTNSIQKTLEIQRFLQQHLPISCWAYVDIFHALRSARSKKRSLEHLRTGQTKILVATEAAGMGADIPDIEAVIQFGVPSLLEVWTQRSGRAGRTPDLQARAILLVERSMFQLQKSVKKKRKSEELDNSSSSDGSDGSDAEPVPIDPRLAWKKVVDPVMRQWIEGTGCRRSFSDEYFNNPREWKSAHRRTDPLGDCCDRFLLPDTILTTLASNARIYTLADMTSALNTPWMLMDRHGEEVIKILQEADRSFRQAMQDARQRL